MEEILKTLKRLPKEYLQVIILELKESEDDRIRKGIIRNLEYLMDRAEGFVKDELKERIAWLEKQDKKKSIDNLTQQEAMDIAVAKCFVQGEQKPTESNNIKGILLVHDETLNNLLERYKTSATFKTLIVNLQNWWNNTRRHLLSFNIEQKLSWSEEDEEIHRKCICAMRASACGFPEEEKFVEQVDNWLKCLKDRYTWKPSEGQLECLGYAIEKAEKDWSPLTNNRIYLTLKALEEQLKKLKS